MSGDPWKCEMGLRKFRAAGDAFGKDGREIAKGWYCVVLLLKGIDQGFNEFWLVEFIFLSIWSTCFIFYRVFSAFGLF